MKNAKFILISSVIAVITLFAVEQLLEIPYIYKTLLKIIIFILLPIYYAKYISKKRLTFMPSIKNFTMSDFKKVLSSGIFIFIIVLGSYLALKTYIDLENIYAELSKIGVTPTNFMFIAIYITFFNSFIEEFFFRGYIFSNLNSEKNALLAYLSSSLLFAVYHIGIFKTWFSYSVTFVALLGLFLGGMIFSWLNSKSTNIQNSWMVHIIADISVMIVGFILFGFI